MIICLCNSISDKVINKAINNGANTVWQVYEACDCKPLCGSCAEYIKESIAKGAVARITNKYLRKFLIPQYIVKDINKNNPKYFQK